MTIPALANSDSCCAKRSVSDAENVVNFMAGYIEGLSYAMDHRDEMRSLTRRAQEHFRNGTTDQAESTMSMPVEAYIDPARYRREVDRFFFALAAGTRPLHRDPRGRQL